MNGGIEFAEQACIGTFPRSWGFPPGSQYSEERAAWVAAKVRDHQRTEVQRRNAQRQMHLHRLMLKGHEMSTWKVR